jgi:chromosome segregation ATPase
MQKPSGHLHKTSIRVDPPLTPDGKKSIEEADKQLDDAKKDYDKLKEKAQDLEFKFKSAARISRHAREGKGEAEDAYYIAAKNQRKAARHAENLAREAQQAAAKQAAHDKYNEVISTANNAASASAPKGASAQKSPPAAAKTQIDASGVGSTKVVSMKK